MAVYSEVYHPPCNSFYSSLTFPHLLLCRDFDVLTCQWNLKPNSTDPVISVEIAVVETQRASSKSVSTQTETRSPDFLKVNGA